MTTDMATDETKKVVKKPVVKFVLDCTKPVDDNVLDAAHIEDFFLKRIKVDGKRRNLGDRVVVSREKGKIYIQAELPFSKRYIKYLIKKCLNQQMIRDFFRVVSTNKSTYELRYFAMSNEEATATA